MTKLRKLQKKKGFTLVELLVVVAILAILSVALLPSVLGYSDKARDTRAAKDIRNFTTVVEAFAATDGNYPEASLDTDNPRSIASVMQSKGIRWTGDETGVIDPWNNPYYYDLTEDYYCIGSSGKDGTLNTSDDICNIGGKVSKKASGLDGNAIPSATPGNNPGNGNEEHLSEVPDGYIGIYTPEQLASIGNDPDYPLDGNYIVMKDLDLSEYENWVPIGDSIGTEFSGNFDGNHYTISNLTVNRYEDAGLFGVTILPSTISNVNLANVDITASAYAAGALVGDNQGTVDNCHVSGGTIVSGETAGGLIGIDDGIITNCSASVAVSANCEVGGLIGSSYDSEISNCYATGSISGNWWYSCAGGLIGLSREGSTVTNSYAIGSVEGSAYLGGLIGNNEADISECYATGSIVSVEDYGVGGLIGYNDGIITNSYATGSVTSNGGAGGLIGNNNASVINCYAVGLVDSVGSYVGGLIGENGGSSTSSYYNSETSGQSDDIGNGTPLTTAQMKDQSNFVDWDFILTWDTDNSYPFLINNEQIPHPGI
jgi:prepilin-type N-terminal cleavage/methylation domain-containing protein